MRVDESEMLPTDTHFYQLFKREISLELEIDTNELTNTSNYFLQMYAR